MWRTFVKARVPRPVWFALRQLVFELQVARLHRTGVREAARYRTGGAPMRLNLACGHVPKDGCREHKYAYDEETLARVLGSVGFQKIQRRAFDPRLDAPNHVIGSLCMTGRKPAE